MIENFDQYILSIIHEKEQAAQFGEAKKFRRKDALFYKDLVTLDIIPKLGKYAKQGYITQEILEKIQRLDDETIAEVYGALEKKIYEQMTTDEKNALRNKNIISYLIAAVLIIVLFIIGIALYGLAVWIGKQF